MIKEIKKHKDKIFKYLDDNIWMFIWNNDKNNKNKPCKQFKTVKDRYFLACFFKIASIKEIQKVNGRLIFNANYIYTIVNLESIINNKTYFKKYLEDK